MPVWRHLLSIILVLTLLAGAPVPAAAQEPGALYTGQTFTGVANISQLLANVNFRDTRGHWAFVPVVRLAAQGLIGGRSQGYFVPEQSVSREEALTLLMRLAGLETAVAQQPSWQQGSPFGPANPTAALAQAYGLLGAREIAYEAEKWQEPVQRQEVAAWAGRLLGLRPVSGGPYPALAGFSDGQQVEPELAPWVEAVLQQGYLSGVRPGQFGPLQTLKRGEMAALMDRLDRQLAARRNTRRVEGQVVDRAESWLPGGQQEITLRVATFAGPVINLEITASSGGPLVDFILLRDGKLTTGRELAPGDPVQLLLQGERVLLAETSSSSQELTGMVLAVNNGEIVFADDSGRQYRYPASSLVLSGTYPGRLPVPGQPVRLTLRDGLITGLATLDPLPTPCYGQTAEGLLNGYLRQAGSGSLTVVTATGQEATVRLSSTTSFTRNGRRLDRQDLLVGDQLLIRHDGAGQALDIKVSNSGSRVSGLFKGRVAQFNRQDSRLVLRDAREFFYGRWLPAVPLQAVTLTREALLKLNGSIAPGTEVVVAVTAGPQGQAGVRVARLEADSRVFEGYLDRLSLGSGELVLLNERQLLELAPEAIVVKNGQLLEAADLVEGDYLFTLATAAGDAGQVALVLTEDLFTPAWQCYRGEIEEVRRESFELDEVEELNSARFWQYDWRESSDMDFDLAWEALISDGSGFISREQFVESRFTDRYYGYTAYTLVRDKVARGLLLLPSSAYNPTQISLGRVKGINQASGRIEVAAVRDWSSGYRRWQDNNLPLLLDAGTALVYKERDLAGLEALQPGDNIYLVHDRQRALLLVANN
ncbi:MAG: S-layer homology domain-containing protein [Clostridia bacterium]|nr:S-layer homology domain-containing protein [Clostridia bacterium]